MHNFEHIKLESLNFDLEATTSESGRVYKTPEGNLYPSITTVLSSYNKKGILEWRNRVGEEAANKISRQAANRGTKLHYVCEQYLLNLMNDMRFKMMMPDTKELFMKLRPYLDKHIGKIYAIEQSLYSDRLGVAGRVDCIAEWDGELAVIDFKTSSKLKEEHYIGNYFMQCSAYAEMFEERTKLNISRIVVAIAVENEEPQIFVREKTKYIDPLMLLIENHKK